MSSDGQCQAVLPNDRRLECNDGWKCCTLPGGHSEPHRTGYTGVAAAIGDPGWTFDVEAIKRLPSPYVTQRAWTLTIVRALPSQNRASHNHSIAASHRYRKERAEWAQLLTLAAWKAGLPLVSDTHKPIRHAVITRVYGKGQQEIDWENVVGGAKMVLDMMCPPRVFKRRKVKGGPIVPYLRPGASLIVDDSPKWGTREYLQERASDGIPCTRIVITDVVAP